MSWHLNLEALEICPCGRLICNDEDCIPMQRLCNGTFYEHPRTDEIDAPSWVSVFTPDEWRAMADRARLVRVAEAAINREQAMESAA